jgi:hypothetical protein
MMSANSPTRTWISALASVSAAWAGVTVAEIVTVPRYQVKGPWAVFDGIDTQPAARNSSDTLVAAEVRIARSPDRPSSVQSLDARAGFAGEAASARLATVTTSLLVDFDERGKAVVLENVGHL